MKSIQSRLLMTLLVSFVALWSAMSIWLLLDLQGQLKQTLDQRLAASARMVAGLVEQIPEHQLRGVSDTREFSLGEILDGVACQVRRRDGELLLQTSVDLHPVFEAAQAGFSESEVDGVRWRLFTYHQGDIMITTADRIRERDALYRGVLTAVAGPVLIALIGMLYATWWGIRVGLRPLHDLRHALQTRDADDLTPITLPMPYELQPLQLSLNQLLQRIDALVSKEKRFTSDAAHELRTPLTAIKTNVQLAQRLPAGEAGDVLQQAELSIGRLQRIIEQLMLLARLDSDDTLSSLTQVSLAEAIAESLADIDDVTRIQIGGNTSQQVIAEPSLLPMILRNLLDNALNYSDGEVTLNVQVVGETIEVAIRDHGAGLSEHHKSLALDRFWRGGEGKGSGLGLAIVSEACKRQHIDLTLSDAHPGLEVTLRLFSPS